MNHKSCGSKGGQRHELTEVVSSAAWPDGFLTHEVRLCVVVCAERVLKRVFPLRLLHLERMFSACVCLFPTFVGWYCLSHAGFLFHRDIADIFQSNRTWEGMVFMPKFVIKNVSCRKTSKRSDSVENAELTNIASNRTLSHSLFAKDVVPILDASFRLDASFSPTCACVLLMLVVFTYRSLVSFFHNDTSDMFQRDRIFFTPLNPFGDNPEEEEPCDDLLKPRKLHYHSEWKENSSGRRLLDEFNPSTRQRTTVLCRQIACTK